MQFHSNFITGIDVPHYYDYYPTLHTWDLVVTVLILGCSTVVTYGPVDSLVITLVVGYFCCDGADLISLRSCVAHDCLLITIRNSGRC